MERYSMMYSNVNTEEVIIGGEVFTRDDESISIPAKDFLQILSQETKNVLLLLDTTRNEKGDINAVYRKFTKNGK